MKKPKQIFALTTILLALSLTGNLILALKYDVSDKIYSRARRFISQKQALSGSDFRKDNRSIVYYLNDKIVQEIQPSSFKTSMEIPDDLIISLGKYEFFGNHYSLEEEGLYRFIFPQKINIQ